MTTRSQKRKAVAELASGEFEASTSENNLVENLVAGPSKSPKIQPERLDEIKMSLRREIISDLIKILVDNQKELLQPSKRHLLFKTRKALVLNQKAFYQTQPQLQLKQKRLLPKQLR